MCQPNLKYYLANIRCSRKKKNVFEHLKILNTIVTRFPNHWWASSCPTTRATHWRDEEQEFFGSISNAVSLCLKKKKFFLNKSISIKAGMQKWGREIQTVNKMVKLGFKDVKKTFPQSTQDRKSSGKIKDYSSWIHTKEDQRCDTSLIICL